MKQKVVEIAGSKMSYWDNENSHPEIVYVLLPPGAASGDFFLPFENYFPAGSRVVAIDYPGRGKSEVIRKFDTIPLIAERVVALLKVLKLENLILVGFSFGSAVTNEIVKAKALDIKKVVLIAPGQYFNHKWESFFHSLFYPATLSEPVRKVYRFLINTFSPIFSGLPKKNLKSILEQWLTIVDYRIDATHPVKFPTTLIRLKKDTIVEKGSIAKIHRLYPNHQEVFLDSIHNWDNDIDHTKDIAAILQILTK